MKLVHWPLIGGLSHMNSFGFSLAGVQSDVLLPSCMHTIAFPIDQQLRCFVTCWPMCCIKSLVSRTCVLYNVHTFLHQSPNSVADRVSGSTGLFGEHRSGEKIWFFLLKELESDTRTRRFCRTYLKANKVSKRQGKLNMHIISESVRMLFTKNYRSQSTLVETTACQSWRVFLRHSVGLKTAAASPPGEWQYIVRNSYLPV